MFANTHELTIAWGDCDPAGIVFYPRFFAMFDDATAALMTAASGMDRRTLTAHHGILGWPMIETTSTFLSPVSFDDRVQIVGIVTQLGRSSFSIEHRMTRGATHCVTCREKRVWAAHGSSGRGLAPMPIPDELRARLMTEEVVSLDGR